MKNLINKFTFNNHQTTKTKLLELIEKTSYIQINNTDKISKTDFYITGLNKEYIDYIMPYITDTLKSSLKSFNIEGFEIRNMWFQQYYKNDIHKFHTHKYTHFACVYYVEMFDSIQKTLIKNFGSNDLIEYNAKEGDIIMFPSFLSHSSPIINTNDRKTIISFNLDIL